MKNKSLARGSRDIIKSNINTVNSLKSETLVAKIRAKVILKNGIIVSSYRARKKL